MDEAVAAVGHLAQPLGPGDRRAADRADPRASAPQRGNVHDALQDRVAHQRAGDALHDDLGVRRPELVDLGDGIALLARAYSITRASARQRTTLARVAARGRGRTRRCRRRVRSRCRRPGSITRCVTSGCPSSGRAGDACRACRSVGAAARDRSRSPSGTCSARGCARQCSSSSRSSSGPASSHTVGCTTRVHLLAHLGIGDAEHRDVEHLRVGDEDVLGFLRIDVHATRHDHERAAIGEVEVALVVEVAHVADASPSRASSNGLLRLRSSLWYSKPGRLAARLEEHGADVAGRDVVAVFVDDVDRREHRPADRTRGARASRSLLMYVAPMPSVAE